METKCRKKMNRKAQTNGSFLRILIALVLFTGFSWLILSVAIEFGSEYGKSANEIGDGSLDVSEYRTNAESVEGNASFYRQTFESGEVDDVDDPSGVFSVLTRMINLITTPFTLIGKILYNVFGVPELIINIILGLLGISLILAIWSVLRAGS